MKCSKVFAIFALLATLSASVAHQKESSEEKQEFECGNKFYRYYLDNEPAEYGFSAGEYAPGKKAYVGISQWRNIAYHVGRIQLNPPGIELSNVFGSGFFSNDSSQIWYLYYNRRHKYAWVNSTDGKEEPFAIEIGAGNGGFKLFIGRIKEPQKPVIIGIVVSFMGVMYYVDHEGMSKSTRTGYQVLTCRSCRNETKIPMPKFTAPNGPPNIDAEPNYINNWLPYLNDDAPVKNGISAGSYDCGNTAYVGKAKDMNVITPGRIQTVGNSGFYASNANKVVYKKNDSYYLADNPNYTYSWQIFDGKNVPSNVVLVRNDVGAFALPVARVKVNGHMRIGKFLYPVSPFSDDNGVDSYYEDYEILVCDPWPKYQCTQTWKFLNTSSPPSDSFNIGSSQFIGRSTRKCINGCDYGLGSATSTGVNYLDDLTATSVFDNSTVEYLIRNVNDTYKWLPSRSGVKVPNALELHREGHRPFYIGSTTINDHTVIGKVRPGEGLFFVDPETGAQKTTSSYKVLTCTSPVAANNLYVEENDSDWFGSFGCPVRKEWSFIQWRCVCKNEFREMFSASNAKWDEGSCSYVSL